MPKFHEGMKVEYHPIGGASGTSTSTGVIQKIVQEQGSTNDVRYEIKNDHTGKSATYKERNITRTL
ncbi:hypothetical protein SJAG_03253 [Schizosaccharomyces japonicus yFS275]|uniref:Hypervirulence associated protein TUDOR domain-containing protein n=1 Tax=Schizosaccharomyces japonicus (strain yFS275 / FY16936) TaxID=402676 RepID=B6K3R2_SCHJY|nr:hypothetical protein SJAG_03253 [Schizosaccharomyces japonicus yFS275]EEB08119.1 hypothetical protein SJAG_03253 [Schizosaccharomyces japonicus yFS275]